MTASRDLSKKVPGYYPMNLLPDSGRFAGKMDPQAVNANGTFAVPGHFTQYNGASNWVSAGRFYNDNSTNGGSASALTQDMQDLMTAMGRTGTDGRYGPEFYIAQTTAGSGTALAQGGGYLLTTNNYRSLWGAGNFTTVGFWIRVKSGSPIYIGMNFFKNQAPVAGGTSITVAEGWKHIRVLNQTVVGIDTLAPYIGATSGSVVQIALPVWVSGAVDFGMHTAPIPSLNGQNS